MSSAGKFFHIRLLLVLYSHRMLLKISKLTLFLQKLVEILLSKVRCLQLECQQHQNVVGFFHKVDTLDSRGAKLQFIRECHHNKKLSHNIKFVRKMCILQALCI